MALWSGKSHAGIPYNYAYFYITKSESKVAKREIIEETGYEGEGFVRLGSLVPTPAYDTEVIELYYARQGKYVGQHLDEDENINLSKLTLDEITRKILSGEVDDAKTVAMTFLIKEFKARGSL